MNTQGEISLITGRYMCNNCGKTIIVSAGEVLPVCPGCDRHGGTWSMVTDLSWVIPNQAGPHIG
jgi:Zn finger protein HypA/HybF involved in hydrogenase expression